MFQIRLLAFCTAARCNGNCLASVSVIWHKTVDRQVGYYANKSKSEVLLIMIHG